MAVNTGSYKMIRQYLDERNAALVAVSKTKSVDEIKSLYDLGQRDFGENYVQELLQKQPLLPTDIHWHFIGHLQTNKVKQVIPFIQLIQSVDSEKLLLEINRQAGKLDIKVACLLQVYISKDKTKFGFDGKELEILIEKIYSNELPLMNIEIKGLMGMATFTEDNDLIKEEFTRLKLLYDKYLDKPSSNINPAILSMGMSADYKMAVEAGSNLVRIGSLLFGAR